MEFKKGLIDGFEGLDKCFSWTTGQSGFQVILVRFPVFSKICFY